MQIVLRRSTRTRRACNLTVAQRRGFKEIRDLEASGAIRVTISDKGGEFVVLPQQMDRAITRSHLSDHTIYGPATSEEFSRQYCRLNRKWTEIAKQANLPRNIITRLKCDTFYVSRVVCSYQDP